MCRHSTKRIKIREHGRTRGRTTRFSLFESYRAQSSMVAVPRGSSPRAMSRSRRWPSRRSYVPILCLAASGTARNDSMRLTDQNGIVTRVNEAYTRFTGLSKDQLENQPFWIIYADEAQSEIRERYLNRFQKGSLTGMA